jgi:hypothetical protein
MFPGSSDVVMIMSDVVIFPGSSDVVMNMSDV